ncbi:MAG: hypothetical protein ACLVFD_15400 [Anaerostipes hadrus]
MLKRNTKTDSENDKNYLTVEEFNAIRRMDFPKDFFGFLGDWIQNWIKSCRYFESKEREYRTDKK